MMLRKGLLILATIAALLVAATPAQAADTVDLRCVYIDENGDIHVSPSSCTYPARKVVYEQCEWLISNPWWPPGWQCVPPS